MILFYPKVSVKPHKSTDVTDYGEKYVLEKKRLSKQTHHFALEKVRNFLDTNLA